MAVDTVAPAIPIEIIQGRIFVLRGQKVMLSSHLAELYDVEPKVLVQAVKRNINRFPSDFVYQLTIEEYDQFLKSQFVTSKQGGVRRAMPYAFTEQGVAMLSSVLRSDRAVQGMRTFVRLREMIASHETLARKLEEMETNYDKKFAVVFEAIRELMLPPDPSSERRIGFRTDAE